MRCSRVGDDGTAAPSAGWLDPGAADELASGKVANMRVAERCFQGAKKCCGVYMGKMGAEEDGPEREICQIQYDT